MENISRVIDHAGWYEDTIVSKESASFIKYLKVIRSTDIVLLHSPLLFSSPYALIAWLLGKPIISIVWDSYPVTLGGLRYDRRLRRRIFDWIENAVLSVSRSVLVPSRDFLTDVRLKQARVLGLWHPLQGPIPAPSYDGFEATKHDELPLQVLFAGQINATRGLSAAVSRLDLVTNGRFHLKVASSDPLPPTLNGHPRVEYLGRLDRPILRHVAIQCDCGLVSLAENFDGPGLPSKSFEYLEAGIPCLYYGKRLEQYLEVLEHSGAGIDISVGARETVTRSEVLARKRSIAASAADFMAVFELEPESFVTYLSTDIS